MNHKVYLSRKNVQTLLNKLDRVKRGEYSACTLIKSDNQHAEYPQTMKACAVTAIEVDKNSPQAETQIYLTRIDLNWLLNRLDSKSISTVTCGEVEVFALENEEYYSDREPGEVLPVDDPSRK